MSVITRTITTVTPLYPGFVLSEEGWPVEISDAGVGAALAAVSGQGWFALVVSTITQKRWTDGGGGELWRPIGEASSYRIYVGESLTVADVERLDDGQDYSILLSNMRGNGWERVVHTRRGNFQPLDPQDVVISEQVAEVPR